MVTFNAKGLYMSLPYCASRSLLCYVDLYIVILDGVAISCVTSTYDKLRKSKGLYLAMIVCEIWKM